MASQTISDCPGGFLNLGMVSFAFFLALNLSVPEKKDIVVLEPVFYILAVIAMAPLFNTGMLLLFFAVGFLIYYWFGHFYVADQQWVGRVFPHMTAIIVFTVISVIKIKKSAEEHYQLTKSLNWHSHHDALTGVLNRSGMFAWLKQKQSFTGQSFEPVSLAMLDLDHFKSINDRYGHDVGDEVIRTSTKVIQNQLGTASSLARFGEEEFLLVLREGSEHENHSCARDILQQFRGLKVSADGHADFGMTTSIGFINHRQTNTFADTLREADDLLHLAKKQSRDPLQGG